MTCPAGSSRTHPGRRRHGPGHRIPSFGGSTVILVALFKTIAEGIKNSCVDSPATKYSSNILPGRGKSAMARFTTPKQLRGRRSKTPGGACSQNVSNEKNSRRTKLAREIKI